MNDLHIPLGAFPRDFELFYFYRNWDGCVDAFQWHRYQGFGSYVLWKVTDISDPNRWYWGAHYVYQGIVQHDRVSRAVKRRGLELFYRHMRG